MFLVVVAGQAAQLMAEQLLHRLAAVRPDGLDEGRAVRVVVGRLRVGAVSQQKIDGIGGVAVFDDVGGEHAHGEQRRRLGVRERVHVRAVAKKNLEKGDYFSLFR